jgi:hypothetical protein
MLCAAAPPVKYQREGAQHECKAQPGQPNLKKLRRPVALGRDTDAVPAGEIDLRE